MSTAVTTSCDGAAGRGLASTMSGASRATNPARPGGPTLRKRNSTTEDRSRKSEHRRDRERHRDTDGALQREDEHRAAGERHGEKRHLHRVALALRTPSIEDVGADISDRKGCAEKQAG